MYLFWINKSPIAKQVVSQLETEIPIFQIPWGHNIYIVSKCESHEEAVFYINKIVKHNYSRVVLIHQIESNLYNRDGKAITNFKNQLPEIHSDLAIETLKDPYCFDFLNIREKHNELELEDALMDNMTKFLLELGQGFSFLGRQYKNQVYQQLNR